VGWGAVVEAVVVEGKMNAKNFIFIGLVGILLLAAIVYVTNSSITGNDVKRSSGEDLLTLKVKIPCSGHAFLIEESLKDAGVASVNFRPSSYFDIKYDSSKISKQEILNLGIFKKYPAQEVD
jgi:hypothetical protein